MKLRLSRAFTELKSLSLFELPYKIEAEKLPFGKMGRKKKTVRKRIENFGKNKKQKILRRNMFKK